MKRFIRILLATAAFAAASGALPCRAAETIRIAVQKTGTFAWELAVIRAHGLDRKADLVLQVDELASPEAGKVALRGGAADVIVSDWLWVARERGLGAKLAFYPYSSALGAVMVSEYISDPDIGGPQGPQTSRRRRPDRQELAVAAGVDEAGWR